jgi:hypothetical protein
VFQGLPSTKEAGVEAWMETRIEARRTSTLQQMLTKDGRLQEELLAVRLETRVEAWVETKAQAAAMPQVSPKGGGVQEDMQACPMPQVFTQGGRMQEELQAA